LLFNSYEFIFVFLPLTLAGYFLFAKYKLIKLSTAWLVFASLAFYSYWDIRYLPLLVSSILFNFTAGSLIEKNAVNKIKSKQILTFAIIVNLCLLGYYKYSGFFFDFLNYVFEGSLFVPNIILPLGISFFTFTQTAYLVDAYRGETKNYSLLTYSLFVTVFPHLIAGPILYHKEMIPQFSRLRNFIFSYKNMALGISIFSVGLFKKVMIADTLAPWAKIVFDNADKVTFLEAWAGALAYTLQLYFDFSGYSEMAIGLGLMFNLKLPINFNSPYKATSIIDFWRRWHMTLSAFLKNYLYIPLGGNRHGEFCRLRNLMLTMLLGGLWHGAGWTFVIWGGLHGFYLVVNHSFRKLKVSLPKVISWSLTFFAVVVAWVFFRAESVYSAWNLISTMSGLNGVVFALPFAITSKLLFLQLGGINLKIAQYFSSAKIFALIPLLILICILAKNSNQLFSDEFNPSFKWAVIIGIFMLGTLLNLSEVSEFLYFQF
jgi:alginate O-acetyltransferase complex protein AlgI